MGTIDGDRPLTFSTNKDQLKRIELGRIHQLLKDSRVLAFLALVIIVPIGFWSKFYQGPLQEWLNRVLDLGSP